MGAALISAGVLGLGGCYQSHSPPDEPEAGDGDSDGDLDADADADGDADGDADETLDAAALIPLAVGARWEYERVDVGGDVNETREITGCSMITVRDCLTGESAIHSVFVQHATGEEPDHDRTLAWTAEGLVRLSLLSATGHELYYLPSFVRVPAGPMRIGDAVTRDFDVCESWVDGPTLASSDRVDFVALGRRVVEVPAGVYDAVGLERTHQGHAVKKRYWYARGIGKVLEERVLGDGSVVPTEALVDFSPGAGSCP